MPNQTNTETKESKPTPPYIPWKTFLAFIEDLSKTSVPVRVDRSVMRGRSGSVQSLLRVALRFLGLIDEQDHSTEKLRQLVKAYKTDSWSEVLGDILSAAYIPVIGNLDLDNATAQQLHEQFRRGGATSSTLRKAVRFYLAALNAAGLTVSPHFAPPPRTSAQGRPLRRLRKTLRKESHTDDASESIEPPPTGTQTLRFPRPSKSDVIFHIPEDLTTEEWGIVEATVRGYIALRKKT